MPFKPDLFIAANDPGLAHAVARSFITASDEETRAAMRRAQASGRKPGSLGRYRAMVGAGNVVAECVHREHGDRAEWALGSYTLGRLQDSGETVHALGVYTKVPNDPRVHYRVPLGISTHAAARMLARTIHHADRHALRTQLLPLLRAYWGLYLGMVPTLNDAMPPEGATLALCQPLGALLGTVASSQPLHAMVRTWVDAEGAADPMLRATCAGDGDGMVPGAVRGLYRVDDGSPWQALFQVLPDAPAGAK